MHKHSLSFPMIPASAPTSPAATRLSKSERDHVSPITPQRLVCSTKKTSRSPITPGSTSSTLYTPLSLRSFLTTSSSVLATPESVTSPDRFSVANSCENAASLKAVNKSIADATANWRFRANVNGMKTIVAAESSFDDDEASDFTPSDANSSFFVNEEVLLPAPFLSNHRRSRTQSNNFPSCPSASPQVPKTSARRTLGVLNTPPPKPTSTRQLKFKGSFTDPSHTRRRPSFGQMSAELFDIDENAFEPYPQSFSSAAQSLVLQDPFRGPILSPISESVSQGFSTSFPEMFINGPAKLHSSSCVICDRSDGTLVTVEPCNHEHCNACFTSALNIVGEKPMECARCKTPIVNFTFNSAHEKPPTMFQGSQSPPQQRPSRTDYPSLPYPFQTQGPPSSAMSLIGGFPPLVPSLPSQMNDNVVLRIDNVPWDITPPAIAIWLKHPIVRGHVLLDEKGKTLSHAYVELATEEIAKAALQSVQNTVLGQGTRARGVTVTRSSQEELMRALFPSWKGTFDGSRPSVTGLQPEHRAVALTLGLMTITELDPLMGLISSPSRFLKVPSLPFYFLISVLSKFCADTNGRVLWSRELADKLFVLTSRALDVLVALLRENAHQDDPDLLDKLLQAGAACQAFTSQQIETLGSIDTACKSALAATFNTSQNWQFPNVVPRTQIPSRSGSYGGIAREFGIDEKLVEELVHRLTGDNTFPSDSRFPYRTLD